MKITMQHVMAEIEYSLADDRKWKRLMERLWLKMCKAGVELPTSDTVIAIHSRLLIKNTDVVKEFTNSQLEDYNDLMNSMQNLLALTLVRERK